MTLRQELRETAEAEVNLQLEEALAGVVEAANALGAQPEDICKALLPRSETIKKKLVKTRLDKIEAILVERYNDQGDLPLEDDNA